MAISLNSIPVLDHHVHSLMRPGRPFGPREFQRFFTESTDETMRADHVPHTVFYRWAIKDLAAFFDCAPTPEAVLNARAKIATPDLAARMFREANIAMLLLDYGFRSAENYSVEELREWLPARVEPILRLETLAQALILQHETFDALVEAYTAEVESARARGHVSLKSIAAYRTGLDIRETPRAEAEAAFRPVREQARREGQIRLANKPLNDYLVLRALEIAQAQAVPIQFHSGFGDADADLRVANPLHLRSLFESPRFNRVSFVVLHAGYPFIRELSHLASLYPNVYMDVSLAVPFIATDIPSLLRAAVGYAPASKILYASDAFSIPELFWLSARWMRKYLARVLEEIVADNALTEAEALTSARQILFENAADVYRVNLML